MKKLKIVLGHIKYRWKNQIKEWLHGREERFHYDIRLIAPMVRTAYYNPKPFGFRTRVMLTERVVEYPSVFQALPTKPTTILDIGSGDSPLIYHFACLGHKVHSVDVLPYPLSHPNIEHHQCDAMRLPFEADQFPVITAISSLEHFGLGGYGDPVEPDAPFRAKEEIRRVLKPGGTFIVSFPVGNTNDPAMSKRLNYNVFTEQQLDRFVEKLEVVKRRFFQHVDHGWLPCSDTEAFGHDSHSSGVTAVVIMELTKPLRKRRHVRK